MSENSIIKVKVKDKEFSYDMSKKSKSEVMRELYDKELDLNEIKSITKSHYSFVYEVVKKYCEKYNKKFITTHNKTISKAQNFILDYNKGMSIGKISRKYETNYNYCHSVISRYRKKQALKK